MLHLKRLLLLILVLNTLGYSSAWAFDEHAFEQFEDELASIGSLSGETAVDAALDEQNNSEIACDHCCHISSHLVAIFPDSNLTSTTGSAVFLLSLNEGVNAFISAPDLEPPRI